MGNIKNDKIISEGWRVGSQTPIDDRLVFSTTSDLIDLGVDDVEAYRNYEGMRVWVISTRSEYEWKESALGALPSSFIYPSGVHANGVVYSGRSFNWVESGGSGSGGSGGSGGGLQVDLVNISAGIPKIISITGAAGITDVQVYYNSEKITSGINIIIGSSQITLESNITLAAVTVKTTF
tara:strand:+ start:461 stop:1000 length:540 start_codon:yes stop_codon:yes gene_type:complete